MKKNFCIFGVSLSILFCSLTSVNGVHKRNQVKAENVDEYSLNVLKTNVSRTFNFDYLPTGKETTAVLKHQNYSNANYRRQDLSTNANIFNANTGYNVSNTTLNTSSQFAGTGCFERINSNGADGLALRANSERGYMDLDYNGDYSINFFVKNYTGNSSYYSGLFSFRTCLAGTALYNVDIGIAGFWLNPVSTGDSSDNTYRKYLTSSTNAWTGRTTYNGFTNDSFCVSSNSDGMHADEWYMITYTFSNTEGISIYRNGVKKVNFTPECKLVTNSGDTDGYTVNNIVQKLRTIMTTKNSRLMIFRGQSSTRPLHVCVDELTIFQKQLSSDDMLLWLNSYKTINYINHAETLYSYKDVVNNIAPSFSLDNEDGKNFYKWSTDTKLLTKFDNIVKSDDCSVYADFKDSNGISDGAKLLAIDIENLDTCNDYAQYNTWLAKINLLDNVDKTYVLSKQYVGADGVTYTLEYKLNYMEELSRRNTVSSLAKIRPIFTDNEGLVWACIAVLLLIPAIAIFIIKIKKNKEE